MTKNSSKMNSSYSGPYPGSDRREYGGELALTGFELRDTLGETEVREASFAEFLAALKKAGKHPG